MIIHYQQDSQGQSCQYDEICAICWCLPQNPGVNLLCPLQQIPQTEKRFSPHNWCMFNY